MCGFLLVLSKEPTDHTEFVKNSLDKLRDRGPDQRDYKSFLDDRLWLGHTRLSINDFSCDGIQPMMSNSGNAIVLNGEIYNFRELSTKFNLKDRLISKTDTEVFLLLLEKFGVEKSISLIKGMFAFAFLNLRNRTISLANDLFGEKPIYYFSTEQHFVASSQLNVVRDFSEYNMKINHIQVIDYLKYGYISGEDSIYNDIKRLLPCSLLEIDIDSFKIKISKYSQQQFNHSLVNQSHLNINDLRIKLVNALKDQLSCDASKGIFLSSGTDSSLMASLSVNELGIKLPSFTASFEGQGWDESPEANLIANQLGLDFHKVPITSELLNEYINIQPSIFHEPFADPAQIASYQISKFAKKQGISVLIGGDGADELFCGYRRLRYSNFISILEKISLGNSLSKFSELNYKILHNFFAIDNQFIYRLEKFTNLLSTDSPDKYFRIAATSPDISKYLKLPTFIPDVVNCNSFKQNLCSLVDELDIVKYLPWDILVKLDRSCMANGVESRSPFLDKHVASYALSFPVKELMGKVHLKRILAKYLTKDLVYKSKRGFGIPLHQLMNQNFNERLRFILKNNQDVFPYIDITAIENIINISELRPLTPNESILLWKILILYKWIEYQ